MRVTVADVVRYAAVVSKIPEDLIVGPRRLQPIVKVRFAVYKIGYELGFTYSQIGTVCGKRDHSTVCAGAAKADIYLERYESFRQLYEAIKRACAMHSNETLDIRLPEPRGPHNATALMRSLTKKRIKLPSPSLLRDGNASVKLDNLQTMLDQPDEWGVDWGLLGVSIRRDKHGTITKIQLPASDSNEDYIGRDTDAELRAIGSQLLLTAINNYRRDRG